MKQSSITLLLFTGFLLVPQLVFAHANFVFDIKEQVYEITIGSLNEPITVDDKTGVDIRVARADETPVTGLENTLSVELIAGDASKILSLDTQFGSPGAYEAPFYPTVATQIRYRVFGDIEGTPFDYTFSCNPTHPNNATESDEELTISEDVTLVQQSGSFGCPAPKATQGFPEDSSSIGELSDDVNEANDNATNARTVGYLGIGIGVIALGVVFLLGRRMRRSYTT